MPRIRSDAQKLADRIERSRAVARAILESGPDEREHVATTGQDPELLRGIPAIARGVAGAVRGSIPHVSGLGGRRRAVRYHGERGADVRNQSASLPPA